MTWKLYDYFDNGANLIKAWTLGLGLDKRQLAKLNAKLDMLQQYGPNLPPGLLSDTKSGKIKKLRINGDRALRPMLCKGPKYNNTEFTLLLGAEEKDRKLIPKDAVEQAEKLYIKVKASPETTRCIHERIKQNVRARI